MFAKSYPLLKMPEHLGRKACNQIIRKFTINNQELVNNY